MRRRRKEISGLSKLMRIQCAFGGESEREPTHSDGVCYNLGQNKFTFLFLNFFFSLVSEHFKQYKEYKNILNYRNN